MCSGTQPNQQRTNFRSGDEKKKKKRNKVKWSHLES